MKRSFLKVFSLLLAVTLALGALALTAGAEETSNMVVEKTFEVSFTETAGSIRELPAGRASFWEFPVLHGGEMHTNGKFTIKNMSEVSTNIALTTIDLPYTDEVAMAYYSHLHLVVMDGSAKLFDNAYTHIADESGGLKIAIYDLKPGESREYTVSLYCDFGYTGNPYEESKQASWIFTADSDMVDPNSDVPTFPLIGKLLMALAILLFVGVVIYVLMVYLKKLRSAPVDDDPTQLIAEAPDTTNKNQNPPPDKPDEKDRK